MNNQNISIHDFIRHLLSATANAALYGMSHPQVVRLSAQSFKTIRALLDIRPEFSLLVVDNELVIDGQPQDLSMFLGRFIQILKSRGVSSLKFSFGVSESEIDSLISGLANKQDDNAFKGVQSTDHIRFGQLDIAVSGGTVDAECVPSGVMRRHSVKLPDMPREELSQFMEIYETVKNRHKLQVNGVYDVVTGFIDVFRQEGKPLLAMANLRDTDEYTFTHSTNVCILNLAQAMALGIEGQLLNDIGVAAMLHDIGKLFIPEEILTKKDKLSFEEYEIMKQHPVKGARHLLETSGVPRIAVITAYEHHMKFNLNGYPKVTTAWQQNLCSHMTMISDFFDALRTRRSYRDPMPLETIAAMMTDMMGTDLHPALTRNFLRIISSLQEATELPSSILSA